MKQDQEVMTYKLMIKQHYETGILYLCVTKRKNWKDYTGSGKRWKNLLTAHPLRILTMLVYTDNDVSRFDEMCRFWSDNLDVVNNENFANLVPEYGYEGNINNFARYYALLNEADRNSFVERRTASISSGRLAMLQEAKQLRSERITVAFQQSESRQSFINNMKIDRLGNSNPNAIEIIWDGLHFSTFKDFNQYVKTHGMNLRACREILKLDKDPNRRRILKPSKKEKQITMLTCMYCDKISMLAHSSAFNRWHNNNCKHKGK